MLDRQTDRGIQILRIISCLAVFFCHFGQRLHINSILSDLYNFSQLGRFGVELFFVISGYLACFSLSNGKSISSFYKKRAIRILPLYYFCILYYFITETLVFKNIPEDAMHLGWLRYIFCLNGIVPSEGYFWSNIGITWTIPVFVVFYLIAPLVVKIAKSTWSSALVLVISIILSILIKDKGNGWFSAFTYMPCFIMGVVVYNAKKESRKFITLLGFQLFILLTKFCEWNRYFSKAIQISELFIISSIFASIVLLSHEVNINNKKSIKVLDFLDEHSYTLYLVHGITFCGIIDKFDVSAFGNIEIDVIFRLVISIIVTCTLTIIIHRFVEKPIQKFLTHKFLH